MSNFCVECGKETKGYGKRCNSCARKKWHKENGHKLLIKYSGFCIECGKKNDRRYERCNSCAGKKKAKNLFAIYFASVKKASQISQKAHPSFYEKAFKRVLEDENISFEWQQIIDFPQGSFNNYCIADFVVESSLIIEIDGDSHLIDLSYDERRDKICKDLGYKILRFTHEEIKNYLEECLKKVKEYIDRK